MKVKNFQSVKGILTRLRTENGKAGEANDESKLTLNKFSTEAVVRMEE